MRWSCDTDALRDGPFGKPPLDAFESRNVVRCDGGREPTPASFEVLVPAAGVPPLPVSKPFELSPPPPQPATTNMAHVKATARRRVKAGPFRVPGPGDAASHVGVSSR